MNDKALSPGDSLPLGMREPSEREIAHARRRLRHMLIDAPEASGTLMGVDVASFSDTDRALAFDWLWDQLQRTSMVARPARFP